MTNVDPVDRDHTIVGSGSGALFSLGVFLAPIQTVTAWSRTGISAVAFLTWVTYGTGSFIWGTLSGRVGVRVVVITGGFLLGLGLVVSSQAVALWQFAIAFGGLVGLAVCAFCALCLRLPRASWGVEAREEGRRAVSWVYRLRSRALEGASEEGVRVASLFQARGDHGIVEHPLAHEDVT